MASYAILSICCPTVLMGIIASEAIGELSKPTTLYSSGNLPYSRINIFINIFAWVSFATNIPFRVPGYDFCIVSKIFLI